MLICQKNTASTIESFNTARNKECCQLIRFTIKLLSFYLHKCSNNSIKLTQKALNISTDNVSIKSKIQPFSMMILPGYQKPGHRNYDAEQKSLRLLFIKLHQNQVYIKNDNMGLNSDYKVGIILHLKGPQNTGKRQQIIKLFDKYLHQSKLKAKWYLQNSLINDIINL